ncbi:hypothetical protein [uncultured Mediterranean phage uvMED]|nr:hypothetical protein [uncultured Mediterranean phage uvMED]
MSKTIYALWCDEENRIVSLHESFAGAKACRNADPYEVGYNRIIELKLDK